MVGTALAGVRCPPITEVIWACSFTEMRGMMTEMREEILRDIMREGDGHRDETWARGVWATPLMEAFLILL